MQNSAVVFRQPTYFLKPVSLGACEAELRSMTSCLCDGTYLRRCIQFVTNVQIEDPPPAKNSSWMNYLMCLTNHGVPHVFARGPAVTNLNAQAPGLDPALFASGLALGTQNQGEPKMIQKKSAITSLVLADSASG